jgi:hypothetical protein
MAIVPVNDLKQRFLTGDYPSAKDFADLIDTIVAIKNTAIVNGSLGLSAFAPQAHNEVLQTDSSGNVIVSAMNYPVVTGDGSLTGTYPSISVVSDGSGITSGIQSQHIRNQAVSLRHYNQAEAAGAPIGASLTWTGAGFNWLSAVSSSALQRVAASGGVRKFKSALIPLPTVPATYTSGGFSQVVAHGLGFSPDTWRAALICINPGGSAGYAQNKELPLNLFVGTANAPVFFTDVDSTNITCVANFVSVGAGADYNMSVYDGTVPGQLDTLSMTGGDFARWYLVLYAETYINGDGFGAVTGWTSALTAFDHVITPLSITNVQGVVPNVYSVVLRNVTTDGTYSPGDEVPISEFTTAAYEPAFTVKATSAAFTVTANTAYTTIQVGSYVITLDNWQAVVRAMYATGNATSIQSPTAIQLHGVRNAVPYNGSIYASHVLGTNQADASLGNYGDSPTVVSSVLSSINVQNGNMIIGAGIVSGNPFPSSDLAVGAGKGCYNTFGRAQMNAVRWPTLGVNAIMWMRGNDTFFTDDASLTSAGPVETVGIPYGADIVTAYFPDTAPPSFQTYGAVQVSANNPVVYNVWGYNVSKTSPLTFYPYPQHSAIVQVDDSGSAPGGTSHPDLYVVGSQFYPLPIIGLCAKMDNCRFGKYSYISSVYTFVGPAAGSGSGGSPTSSVNSPVGAINWFNANIVNITARNADIFASNLAYNPIYYVMVRYNPVKNLFYVIDALTGLLHIYSLVIAGHTGAATLPYWLGSGSTALDYTKLTYTGSYVLPIGPSRYDTLLFEDKGTLNWEPSMRDSWTVEFDLVSGAEISICVARGGSNEITRIPWIYPI